MKKKLGGVVTLTVALFGMMIKACQNASQILKRDWQRFMQVVFPCS